MNQLHTLRIRRGEEGYVEEDKEKEREKEKERKSKARKRWRGSIICIFNGELRWKWPRLLYKSKRNQNVNSSGNSHRYLRIPPPQHHKNKKGITWHR